MITTQCKYYFNPLREGKVVKTRLNLDSLVAYASIGEVNFKYIIV